MNTVRNILVAAGCALVPHLVSAGTAAFMPGDARIVRAGHESLWIFDPETGKEAPLELPAAVGRPAEGALTASTDHLFVAAGRTVIAWDGNQWLPWWTAPEQATVEDIAYDPKHARLLVLTSSNEEASGWWITTAAGDEGRRIFNRRAGGAGRPVFDTSGMVYF